MNLILYFSFCISLSDPLSFFPLPSSVSLSSSFCPSVVDLFAIDASVWNVKGWPGAGTVR